MIHFVRMLYIDSCMGCG